MDTVTGQPADVSLGALYATTLTGLPDHVRITVGDAMHTRAAPDVAAAIRELMPHWTWLGADTMDTVLIGLFGNGDDRWDRWRVCVRAYGQWVGGRAELHPECEHTSVADCLRDHERELAAAYRQCVAHVARGGAL